MACRLDKPDRLIFGNCWANCAILLANVEWGWLMGALDDGTNDPLEAVWPVGALDGCARDPLEAVWLMEWGVLFCADDCTDAELG